MDASLPLDRAPDTSLGREQIQGLLEALWENLPIGVGFIDRDLRYRWLNRALASLNGLPAADHLGRRVSEVLPPGIGAGLEVLLNGVLASGEPVTGLEVTFGPEGDGPTTQSASAQIRGSFVPVAHGVVAIIEDVTTVRINERARERAAERLQTLIEAIPAVTYVEIPDGDAQHGFKEVYVSPQVEDVFGLTQDEWLHEPDKWRSRIHPDDLAGVQEAMDHAVTTRAPFRREYRVIPRPGVIRFVREETHLIDTEEGSAWQGLILDVTEERRAAQQQVARQAAEGASRAKSEFLSRMSHELRTPLNAVLGFAQILELESAEADKDAVAQILVGGRALVALIDEALDLSRIEMGVMEMRLVSIDISAALARSMALMRPLAHDSGLEITAEACENLFASADESRFDQILMNLISNAVKYNKPRGRISLRSRRDGSWVSIEVEDTGIGIPQDQLDQVFEPFERLGAERTAIQGAGLGLAVTHRLVEAMGGEIEVHSQKGSGSTFIVRLKIAHSELDS